MYINTKKIVLVSLVDKRFGEYHSFVDGCLRDSSNYCNFITKTIVLYQRQKNRFFSNKAIRSDFSIGLLLNRKSVFSMINILIIGLALLYIRIKIDHKLQIVVFVRNDPIYLLSACLFKWLGYAVVFQSSFPHEEYSGSNLKRISARFIFRVCNYFVDTVTGVSSIGLTRLKLLFPNSTNGPAFPLMISKTDLVNQSIHSHQKTLRILYVGSLESDRQFGDVIIQAILLLSKSRNDFKIDVYGDNLKFDALMKKYTCSSTARNLSELIHCYGSYPRPELLGKMTTYDIGLCLIPPDEKFREATPTKLVEYMGSGLAVIGSYGIPFIEQTITNHSCGILVDFNSTCICEGLNTILNYSTTALNQMKHNSILCVKNNFTYESHGSKILSSLLIKDQ